MSKTIICLNREPPPCYGCTERFTACSDRCPKDLRGEYGYKAWTAETERIKQARREHDRKLGVRLKKNYTPGRGGRPL